MTAAARLLPRMHPALCQYPLGRTRTPGRARRLTHMAEPATIEPQRKLRPNAVVEDALFAGALLLMIGLPSVAGATALGAGAVSAVVGSITSLGMPAALAWRRTRPVHSAVAVYAMALAHVLAGLLLTGSDLLIFVSLYSVTVYGPVWARRTALGSGFLGCLIVGGWYAVNALPNGLLEGLMIGGMFAGMLSALVLAAWAVGLMRRARLVQIETLAERAARLERERDQQSQIAAAAERARIAREMHDIVAHSLSVIIAQADGGRYAAATSPEAATHALTTISEAGRDALADMRRLLGVLRADAGSDDSLTPQPAQADLDELVAHVKVAGLGVSLVRMGTARVLPPGAGLTIYRIAQESLTNIFKHGGPGASATVLVQWTPASLVLQVDDDGRGAAATSDGDGHGVLGMRERAQMLGGTLTAGPREGGGFRVRAEIPVPAGAPVEPQQWHTGTEQHHGTEQQHGTQQQYGASQPGPQQQPNLHHAGAGVEQPNQQPPSQPPPDQPPPNQQQNQ